MKHSLFVTALLAGCTATTSPPQTPVAEAAPVAPHTHGPRLHPAQQVNYTTISAINGNEATVERTAPVEVSTAFSSARVSEYLLSDPIGEARFRVAPDTIAVRIDGHGALLVSAAVETPCTTVEVAQDWPTEDALTATRQVDRFELCRDRGVTARERVTTFPAGSRRVRWQLEP